MSCVEMTDPEKSRHLNITHTYIHSYEHTIFRSPFWCLSKKAIEKGKYICTVQQFDTTIKQQTQRRMISSWVMANLDLN